MENTKVVTGEVRFSYAHVFEPTAMSEDQEKKYSTSLLIPKTDKETVTKIKRAIAAALEEGKTKFGGKIPAAYKNPLRDGDAEYPEDEVMAGHYFINAKNSRRPGVVDRTLNPILDKDEFYSGCYGRASITFYAFNTAGNKGVAVSLNNVQKLRDGESLAGGSSAADDFGAAEDIL